MGRYFRMSKMFNKRSPQDFGLTISAGNAVIDPRDGTIWIFAPSYDFGWGKENGFYKLPELSFPELISLIGSADNEEDLYGAAAFVLDRHTDALLEYCEQLLSQSDRLPEFRHLAKVLKLQKPLNRCAIVGKRIEQIDADNLRWKAVADAATQLLPRKSRKHRP